MLRERQVHNALQVPEPAWLTQQQVFIKIQSD